MLLVSYPTPPHWRQYSDRLTVNWLPFNYTYRRESIANAQCNIHLRSCGRCDGNLSHYMSRSHQNSVAGNIRDAEIEHTIGFYAAPLLKAAGLMPEDVKFHIVNDRGINAFVARGRRIFITSGLLMAADSPEQVAGVLAHEIGHITGGHLARLSSALNNARRQALIGEVIGFALGAFAKESSVAATTIAKSSEIATKGVYKFSRTQERSADQLR